MNKSGGGSATNSGIDFQQRVAAFFVLSMGLDLDCSIALEQPKEIKIKKVSFETSDSIDDIKLIHKTSITYIQAKRKLSLSDSSTSEFFKTFEQFYNQNCFSQNPKDRYALITTNDSSKKITNDIKKITTSLRLNIDAVSDNPFSLSEKDTLGKIYSTLNAICIKNEHPALSSEKLTALLKKIYVITLDVEKGGVYENAFLTSIACRLSTRPELLWNHIISNGLNWSKNRQSIDINGITSLLENFVIPPVLSEEKSQSSFSFDPEHFKICSGREVLLMEKLEPGNDLIFAEERRFDSDGKFRLNFSDEFVEMPNGQKFKLHARFSTLKGASRFLSGESILRKKKLLVIESPSLTACDDESIALAYSEKIRAHISKSTDISKCIHCGDGFSHDLLYIEVNEVGLPFDTGIIHKTCRRPSDRVLGTGSKPGIEIHPELRNFDYKKWFAALPQSQALWGSFKYINTKIKNIVWTPEEKFQEGSHCIKITLADGSSKIVQHRGQVQRYSSEAADAACTNFSHQTAEARAKNNPLCYSNSGDTFSDKKSIMELYQDPFPPIECVAYEKISYTRGLATIHNTCKNFYAPVALVIKENHDPLLIKNSAFLITDPFALKNSLENWKGLTERPENYRLKIIETDQDFDRLLFKLRESFTPVLIDPIFDDSGELFSGATIQHINDIMLNFAPARILSLRHEDHTYSYILKNNNTDNIYLLSKNCKKIGCSCLGCRILEAILKKYGNSNCNTRYINQQATVTALDAQCLNTWATQIAECPASKEDWGHIGWF